MRRGLIAVPIALCGALVIPLAALRTTDGVPLQIVPGPPTTPQPTVPCTPPGLPGDNGGAGCGRGTGTQRDVAYAWIDRYCNGDAVPTPPGFTTFAVNYGLGGQSLSPVQFNGVATVNGTEVPTFPLDLLNPGEKDTRIRAVVVPNDALVEFTITGISVNTGEPVVFGNGTTVRVRSALGGCPVEATPLAPPIVETSVPGEPPSAVPPNNTVPEGSEFPPTK